MSTEEQETPTAKQPDAGLPLIAIGGRWGKTTTARLLEAILTRQRAKIAIWTNQGVWSEGRRQQGELLPWGQALHALVNGRLDYALQELDAHTVVAVGLPAAAYRLAIFTSFCANDKFCQAEKRSQIERQAQMAIAKALQPDGLLVINADDAVLPASMRADPKRVIYYSLTRRNPIVRAHLAAGHRAVTVSSGMIVLCEGTRSWPLLPRHDVALAIGGTLGFQVQNALAAVASAWYLGVSVADIAATLYSFTSAPNLLPGSCNQLQIKGGLVVLDSFRDMVSLRLLVRGLRKVPNHRQRIIVLSGAQLPLHNTAETGRLIRQAFDQIIIHHDPASKRRPADDALAAAKSLRTSIARTKLPPIVTGLNNEAAALTHLLQHLHSDDLALVLAVDHRLVLRRLMAHRDPAPH